MVSSKTQAKKDDVINGLIEARACILAAASSLPAEKQDDVFLGVWSVKDLLAHLAGWDFTNIEAAKDILDDRLPGFYAHHDRDWRTYNARLVARYRKDDFAELVSSVKASHQELIGFLKTIPAEEFERDRGLRAGRYKVTIAALLWVEIRDEKRHCAQIVTFAEAGRASRERPA